MARHRVATVALAIAAVVVAQLPPTEAYGQATVSPVTPPTHENRDAGPTLTSLKDRVARVRAEFGSLGAQTGRALYDYGVAQADHGDAAGAEKSLRDALVAFEHALGSHAATATVLDRLATLLAGAGHAREAEELWKRALSMLDGIGADASDSAAVAWSLGQFYRRQGRSLDASIVLQRALEFRERALGPEHLEVARAAAVLASVLRDMDQLDRARDLLTRALTIREKLLGPDDRDVVVNLSSLGLTLDELGDYAGAERRYAHALQLMEHASWHDDDVLAMLINNLASVYLALDDTVHAESAYRRAIALDEQRVGPDHVDPSTLDNLAQVYDRRRDFAAAEPLYQRCLKLREKAQIVRKGEAVPPIAQEDLAYALNNFAAHRKLQGDFPGAQVLYERALAIFEAVRGEQHHSVAVVLDNLASLALSVGDPGRAEALEKRALAIFEQTYGAFHPALAKSEDNLARAHVAMGRPRDALKALTRAEEIRESARGPILGVGSEPQRIAYLDALRLDAQQPLLLHAQQMSDDPEATRLAFRVVASSKGLALDSLAESARLQRYLDRPETRELAARLADLRAQIANGVFRHTGDRAGQNAGLDPLPALVSAADATEQALAQASGGAGPVSGGVTFEDVQRHISPGSLLLEFYAYGTGRQQRVGAFAVASDRPLVWWDIGDAASLDSEIATARHALSSERIDPTEMLRALRRRLLGPVEILLERTRHVIVSPDAQVSLLPFGALVDEHGRYLNETHQIAYVTSARDLLRTSAGPAAPAAPSSAPLVLADPLYGTPGGKDSEKSGRRSSGLAQVFLPLPGTKGEARAFMSRILGARDLEGADATETALKHVKGPRVLHLATHGFFLADAPWMDQAIPSPHENSLLRSGVALAGANTTAGGEDDGILTALEASGLDLAGTDLVVLSACETGVGGVYNGDGVYGLRRALAIAGAKAQVVSLWKVDDDATEHLMTLFYDGIRSGTSPSLALRNAQLAMIHDREFALPYFWSAFIAIGDVVPPPVGHEGSMAAVRMPVRGCACNLSSTSDGTSGMVATLVVLGGWRRRWRRATVGRVLTG